MYKLSSYKIRKTIFSQENNKTLKNDYTFEQSTVCAWSMGTVDTPLILEPVHILSVNVIIY